MKEKTSALRGKKGAPLPADSAPFQVNDAVLMKDLSNAAIADFSAERDEMLESALPGSAMPENEEAFYARDPFSADYADFLKEKANQRRGPAPRVNAELRADLLSKPFLMERPEEAAQRGAAAVWRSLRDQLHNESLAIIDASNREEILMLQRDLQTRKALVAAVMKGIEDLLKRVEQRLVDTDAKPAAVPPVTPPQTGV